MYVYSYLFRLKYIFYTVNDRVIKCLTENKLKLSVLQRRNKHYLTNYYIINQTI